MRPNDLIFNFLVNDWLLGEKPPASDILAWNVDMANFASAFNHDMLKVYAKISPPSGQLSGLNRPIDLTEVDCDAFILAGSTDHITPWQTCFMTSQVTGGRSEFVLALTGHVLALVNPPGRRAHGIERGPCPAELTSDEWLAQEHRAPGLMVASMDGMAPARSGATHTGPQQARRHPTYPAIDPAPGRYVRET